MWQSELMQKVPCWTITVRSRPAMRKAARAVMPGFGVAHEGGVTITEGGRDDEAREGADPLDVAVLPHDERVGFEVLDVGDGRLRLEAEEEPADVGVEEALGDIVQGSSSSSTCLWWMRWSNTLMVYGKCTSFSYLLLVKPEEVQKAVELINHRPRKCLDYRTPFEVFYELSSDIDALHF
jgi:hypothetical protein